MLIESDVFSGTIWALRSEVLSSRNVSVRRVVSSSFASETNVSLDLIFVHVHVVVSTLRPGLRCMHFPSLYLFFLLFLSLSVCV